MVRVRITACLLPRCDRIGSTGFNALFTMTQSGLTLFRASFTNPA
jgi:hypothetical protein